MKPFSSRILQLSLATAAGLAIATPALAKDGLSVGSEGIKLKEGEIKLTLGGRLHLDATAYNDGVTNDSTADWRRARIEFAGEVGDFLRFRVDREFAGTDGWRNVWVAVRPVKGVTIKGGNYTVPFSLEDMQSSNDITFAERSLVGALAPGFGVGGGASIAKKNWSVSAGYFGDALDDADGRTKERGRGFAGRVTAAPMKGKKHFLHLALAYEHRSFHDTEVVRFSNGIGSNLAPSLIRTGPIAAPSKLNNIGVELAYARRSIQFQGQFVSTRLSRDLASTLKYSAWYAQASWMLTGENYQYSEGMGGPSGPKLHKHRGGVELAARFSQIDLDDVSLDQGKASTLTAGANWYVNRNVRLMANYAHSRQWASLVTPDRNTDLGVVRLQIAF